MYECQYFSVTDDDILFFTHTYPGVRIEVELQKMQAWLWANPERRKKNMRRFITNWLAKTHGRLLEKEVEVLVREDIRRSRVPI